jgi:serine kinase of HPr protein (carbohydrate metabolism regulator)
MVRKVEGRLIASAPPTIKGKLEVRGIGIVEIDSVDDVPVCLLVELSDAVERMPEAGLERMLLGAAIPLIGLDAMSASAAAKVDLALNRMGLKA